MTDTMDDSTRRAKLLEAQEKARLLKERRARGQTNTNTTDQIIMGSSPPNIRRTDRFNTSTTNNDISPTTTTPPTTTIESPRSNDGFTDREERVREVRERQRTRGKTLALEGEKLAAKVEQERLERLEQEERSRLEKLEEEERSRREKLERESRDRRDRWGREEQERKERLEQEEREIAEQRARLEQMERERAAREQQLMMEQLTTPEEEELDALLKKREQEGPAQSAPLSRAAQAVARAKALAASAKKVASSVSIAPEKESSPRRSNSPGTTNPLSSSLPDTTKPGRTPSNGSLEGGKIKQLPPPALSRSATSASPERPNAPPPARLRGKTTKVSSPSTTTTTPTTLESSAAPTPGESAPEPSQVRAAPSSFKRAHSTNVLPTLAKSPTSALKADAAASGTKSPLIGKRRSGVVVPGVGSPMVQRVQSPTPAQDVPATSAASLPPPPTEKSVPAAVALEDNSSTGPPLPERSSRTAGSSSAARTTVEQNVAARERSSSGLRLNSPTLMRRAPPQAPGIQRVLTREEKKERRLSKRMERESGTKIKPSPRNSIAPALPDRQSMSFNPADLKSMLQEMEKEEAALGGGGGGGGGSVAGASAGGRRAVPARPAPPPAAKGVPPVRLDSSLASIAQRARAKTQNRGGVSPRGGGAAEQPLDKSASSAYADALPPPSTEGTTTTTATTPRASPRGDASVLSVIAFAPVDDEDDEVEALLREAKAMENKMAQEAAQRAREREEAEAELRRREENLRKAQEEEQKRQEQAAEEALFAALMAGVQGMAKEEEHAAQVEAEAARLKAEQEMARLLQEAARQKEEHERLVALQEESDRLAREAAARAAEEEAKRLRRAEEKARKEEERARRALANVRCGACSKIWPLSKGFCGDCGAFLEGCIEVTDEEILAAAAAADRSSSAPTISAEDERARKAQVAAAERREKLARELEGVFTTLPAGSVRKALLKHNWAADKATEELLEMQRAIEEAARAEEEEKRRREEEEKTPTRAKARYDYDASDGTELTLREGDLVRVLKSDPSGWWIGELKGAKGLFPANYCKVLYGDDEDSSDLSYDDSLSFDSEDDEQKTKNELIMYQVCKVCELAQDAALLCRQCGCSLADVPQVRKDEYLRANLLQSIAKASIAKLRKVGDSPQKSPDPKRAEVDTFQSKIAKMRARGGDDDDDAEDGWDD